MYERSTTSTLGAKFRAQNPYALATRLASDQTCDPGAPGAWMGPVGSFGALPGAPGATGADILALGPENLPSIPVLPLCTITRRLFAYKKTWLLDPGIIVRTRSGPKKPQTEPSGNVRPSPRPTTCTNGGYGRCTLQLCDNYLEVILPIAP